MHSRNTGLSIDDNKLQYKHTTIRTNLSYSVLATFDKGGDGNVIGRHGYLHNKKGEMSIDRIGYDPGTGLNVVSYEELKSNYHGHLLDLSNLDLAGAELCFSNFAGVNFSGSDLIGADLSGANLVNANLSHANLTGASLMGATLTGANLTGAILTGARLSGVDLTGVITTAAVM